MLARTAKFDAAIVAGAPQTVVQATLLRKGTPLRTVQFLPGSTVSLDETSASRRTLKATLGNDGTLDLQQAGASPLAPYGVELAVRSGVQYTDGTVETVPAGIFRLQTVSEDTLGLISISAPDRSTVVSAATNEQPYVIPGYTPLDNAIAGYLHLKYPQLPFVADPAAHVTLLSGTPTVFPEGNDGWADCMTMANDFGRELFVDAYGVATLRPIPDPRTTTPCWQYVPGETNLATVGTNTLDTTPGQVYNVVVVSSSGTGINPPVTGTAEVVDPASPIYPDPNGFGRRPLFYQSTQIATTEQCVATAEALLNRYQGRWALPAFTAVPHPCHEPGDVVVYESTALGVATAACLSSWTLQLDQLTGSAYRTRVAASTLTAYTTLGSFTTNRQGVNPANPVHA